jgi:hypothetical protein
VKLREQQDSVTGGAGFIGSHLCERLLADGAEVICVDNYFTSSRRNIAHLLSNPLFEAMRHDVTFPLYVKIDATLPARLPRSITSVIPCKRPRRACTARSVCWARQTPRRPRLSGLHERSLW